MRHTLGLTALILCACASAEDAGQHAHVARIEAFRELRESGDLAGARALLVDGPRIWYGERDGDGSPWTLGGGRWKAWDDYFRGTAVRATEWHVDGEVVWADVVETNDYYRLVERPPSRWRATYFIAEDGRIEGFLVGRIPGLERDGGRDAEFEAWARETHPEEAEYLMPGGSIDPTGDRPQRMRALLELWRAEGGLPPLE